MGVGAELPEKQVESGPGELKLKNKMLGKKRERKGPDSNDAATVLTPEDDDEKSRSRVIQKKPRLDPFVFKREERERTEYTKITLLFVFPPNPLRTPPVSREHPLTAVLWFPNRAFPSRVATPRSVTCPPPIYNTTFNARRVFFDIRAVLSLFRQRSF